MRDNSNQPSPLLARLVLSIERLNEVVGRAAAWLVVIMVVNTFIVAVLRYGFHLGWIWLQESYIWMHGIVFLLAAAYTFLADGHVRIDIFYRPAAARTRAWINILGTLGFLYPMLALIWWVAYPYVRLSWMRHETSPEANGLPALYLLKTCMLVFVVLMALQGLALIIRSLLVLRGHPEWDPERRTVQAGA